MFAHYTLNEKVSYLYNNFIDNYTVEQAICTKR